VPSTSPTNSPRGWPAARPRTAAWAELALGDAVLGFLTATRNNRRGRGSVDAAGLWRAVAEYADSVPETERRRRMIVDRLHNTRTDRSHPANHLRLALLAARPQLPAALTVTDAQWAAIDAELEPGYQAVARAYLG
jgi:hypothetical protein